MIKKLTTILLLLTISLSNEITSGLSIIDKSDEMGTSMADLLGDVSLNGVDDVSSNSLYGKPICVNIPRNMSLCKNINYSQMKMPNLLGHETIDEIEYQSSAWLPLVASNCHRDTQMFLCSLFAPVCVNDDTTGHQAAQVNIYPCRSLCESIQMSCEATMLKHSYPWPSMFNCSRFPQENGLCVQLSSSETQHPVTTPATTTTTLTTSTTKIITATSSTKRVFRNKTRTNSKANVNVCHGCQHVNDLKMEKIVESYCKSDLVFRGRIQSVKLSHLDLRPLNARKSHQAPRNRSSTNSLYVRIGKRDRKILKGFRHLSPSALNKYLSENVNQQSASEIDLFLLSEFHLTKSGKLMRRARKSMRQRRQRSNMSSHCTCEKLRRTFRKSSNLKYFITANVLRTKNLFLNPNLVKGEAKKKRLRNKLSRRDENMAKKGAYQSKLIYMTSIVQWNKARPFIDYLEDDAIDKANMCHDIKATVRDIGINQRKLF